MAKKATSATGTTDPLASPPPAPILAPEQRRLAEVERAKSRVNETEARFLVAREKAKELKTAYESALQDLRHAGDPLPLLDGIEDAAEGWRKIIVRELTGLSESIFEKLAESGIETLGDFVDHNATGEKIPGIGKAKMDKIADALEVFWGNHPEYGNPNATPATGDPSNDDAGDDDGLGLDEPEHETDEVLGDTEED